MTGSDTAAGKFNRGSARAWLHTAAVAAPLAAGAVTVTRCLQAPSAWAATQALFTCDIALKRCALGQAIALLHIPAGRFAVYSALSYALLAMSIALLGAAFVRSSLTASAAGLVMVASLAASYGFGVFVSLNGFLDVPMVILAVCGLLAPRRWQATAIAAAAAMGVLVHEAYLVVFLPAALLPLVLRAQRPGDLIAPLAIVGVALLITAFCALDRPLAPEKAQRAFDTLQARADFRLEPYSLAILRRSLADNLAMMGQLARTPWFWSLQFANIVLLAPVLGLFVVLVCRGWSAPWPAKLATIGAALTPLAMNGLGYDVLRWGGLCILAIALALGAMASRYGAPRLNSPLFPGVAALLAVVPLFLPPAYSHQAGAPPQVQAILQHT